MPYRKEQFVTGEFYHIVLRAIDDNIIFKDIDDHYRGIFSIYEFNDIKPVVIQKRRQARVRIKKTLMQLKKTSRGPSSTLISALNLLDLRDKLVEVLAFCIMPNHIHLLVRQLKDGGMVKFMRKFGTGYAVYFNKKYGRKGYVFQSRFLAIHIKTDKQLKIIFVYIHTNPISLIEPKWKERGIRNPKKVNKFIKEYKWSSLADYLGKINFPSLTEREFLSKTMGGQKAYEKFIENWIRYKERAKEAPELFLE